jgi:hypothetical protein
MNKQNGHSVFQFDVINQNRCYEGVGTEYQAQGLQTAQPFKFEKCPIEMARTRRREIEHGIIFFVSLQTNNSNMPLPTFYFSIFINAGNQNYHLTAI